MIFMQFLAQADFREEDVEISERVEELTNSLSDLCHGYHIPLSSAIEQPYYDPDAEQYDTSTTSANQIPYDISVTPTHQGNNSQGDSTDDEDYLKFSLNHSHLKNYGYSTLPLPPPATRPREQGHSQPIRSFSYEGRDVTSYHTTQHKSLAPRNSYPQEDTSPTVTYWEREYRFRTPHEHRSRPVSFQEIFFEEDYYEQHLDDNGWTDLSCP